MLISSNILTRPWSASPRGWLLLAVLGLGFFLPGRPVPAEAQSGSLDLIGDFIERNGELLEWAGEIVSGTESVPARRVLQEAHRLHEKSLNLFLAGRPRLALGAARRSRAALWHAVGLAREALSFEERLRIRGERFRDLHAHLLEKARESNDQRARELIRRAGNQALRSREQFIQGDAKLAFKLLEIAEQLLQRAARLLADGAGPERLDREIDRTAVLLDRTREMLADDVDPAALNLLAEAEEALDRAREHRDRGQPGRALQMAGLAQKLAGRAQARQIGGPDAETVRQQLERWDDKAALVGERVAASGSEPARKHFELARQHRDKAQHALADGRVEQALRQIRAAHDQLAQAEGLTR